VSDEKMKTGEEAAEKAAKAAKAKAAAEAKGKGKKGKDAAAGNVRIAAAGETKVSPAVTPRLEKLYRQKVVSSLMKQFDLKNPMEVPRIKKVTINCAVKEAVGNPKVLDGAYDEIMAITGQKPILTRARKAIATFKVREGNAVGVMVTLRRARMYEFLDRLRFVKVMLWA